MKICHWSLKNNSGMHRVAESIAKAEIALGLDSSNVDCSVQSDEWEGVLDADVHVVHTHFPDSLRKRVSKKLKIVWVAHGTPDHVFQSSVEYGQGTPYGHPDPFMLMQYWLRNADARVTFWPRHKWIYDRMVDRGTEVYRIPLGLDKAFWEAGVSRGKYAGEPSVLTAENPHYIKWGYDLWTLWPYVMDELHLAKLHNIYAPRDLHRWLFPLINSNGTSYGAHVSPITFPHDELRNVFRSVDFYCGLVRYGDFNQISLQANASGAKTISYAGNEYSDFWITEGDQRIMTEELLRIMKGEVEPREKSPVPDIAETAQAFKQIYESILDAPPQIIVPAPIPAVDLPKPQRKKRTPVTPEGIAA